MWPHSLAALCTTMYTGQSTLRNAVWLALRDLCVATHWLCLAVLLSTAHTYLEFDQGARLGAAGAYRSHCHRQIRLI